MLHERANREPQGIHDGELILNYAGLELTGMGILPLIGREAGDDVEHEADDQVGTDDVQPDFDGEWRQEGEQIWLLLLGPLVQDAYAQVEEGLGEGESYLFFASKNVYFLARKWRCEVPYQFISISIYFNSVQFIY